MAKICLREGCNKNVFSNGYCLLDQRFRTDAKYLAQKNKVKKVTPIKSSSKPIKKFSTKYQKEVNKYNTRVKEWKLENPYCKVPGCNEPTTDNHHKRGRGIYLNDEIYWFPTCREHHNWIENNPIEAKEMGFSLNRLSND